MNEGSDIFQRTLDLYQLHKRIRNDKNKLEDFLPFLKASH